MPELPDNIVPITSDVRSAAEKFSAEHDRELLTILFTDLVDSTKLQSDLGNVEAARLTELHRSIVRAELSKYDAREIEWAGDSCLAVFTKPSDAVVFALRMQAEHRRVRESEPKLSLVRVGMHLGEIVVKKRHDGGKKTEDLFGLQVSEAARVMSVARGDQVFCTRAVFDNARGALKGRAIEGVGDAVWVNYGAYLLKGSEEPVELCEIGSADVAVMKAPEANDKVAPVLPGGIEAMRALIPYEGDGAKSHGLSRWAIALSAVVLIAAGLLGGWFLPDSENGRRAGSSEGRIGSLAVLPFQNISGDPEQEYFVDGMTEALTAELAKIGALKVISRTSTMSYKGTETPIPEIARALDVDVLVEGSVYRAGDEVRITAQLVHGPSDTHLWAESYEGALEDVLGLQSEVALAIAREIQIVVTPEEEARISNRYKTTPEAYDEYLRGMSRIRTRSEAGMRAAIAHFERVVAMDSEFAPAYARLADAYNLLPIYWLEDPDIAFPKAKEYALRALEIDEKSSEAYAALGLCHMTYSVDAVAAEHAFQRAIALDANNLLAHTWYAQVLIFQGHNDEARRQHALVAELDPNNLIGAIVSEGWATFFTGDLDGAEKNLRSLLDSVPDHPTALIVLVEVYRAQGDWENAVATAERLVEVFDSKISYRVQLAGILAESGQTESATEILQEIEGLPPNTFISPHALSNLYFALGDKARGFEILARARGEIFGLSTLRTAPTFEGLRDDDRYWKIIDSLDLQPLPPSHPVYKQEQAWLRKKAAEAALAAQPKPVGRFTIELPQDRPLLFDRGSNVRPSLAVSNDGTRIVYAAEKDYTSQLYLRYLDAFDAKPVPDTDGAYYPFFSPDGAWIGFFTEDGLKKVSVTGGGSILLCPAPNAWGAVWAPDDTILFNPFGTSGFWRIPAAGGEPDQDFTVLNFMKNDQAHNGPSVGPDQSTIFYSVWMGGSTANSRIEAVSLTDSNTEPRVLLTGGSNPYYTSSGHLVYARANELLAVAMNPTTFETGTPVTVFTGILADRHYETPQYALSPSGLLVFAAGDPPSTRFELVWVDREGNESAISESPGPYRDPDLSPDGKRIVYTNAANQNIWVYDIERGTQTPLTSEPSEHAFASYSPDGEEIAFGSTRDGIFNIFRMPSDGSGEPEPISDTRSMRRLSAWTPDGMSIVYTELRRETNIGLWTISLDGAEDGERYYDTPAIESLPALSSNGWIAYQSDKSGRAEVYVRRFADRGPEFQASRAGGKDPFWSSGGDELFYQSLNGDRLMGARVRSDGGPDEPQLLFDKPNVEVWDVDESGTRFLGVRFPVVPPVTRLHVVQNFNEELNRLAPHSESN